MSETDPQLAADTAALSELMQRITGEPPKSWNVGTLGFGQYHYRYASGREGDTFVLGFYPRPGKITIYVMDGTARYAEALSKLGKHTVSGYCIFAKQLSDLNLAVLEQILRQSHDHIAGLAAAGPIDRILWKDSL